ncbi:MAG: hypothetical protein KIT34_17695 [Cyanobacteria bacterium TGS_CYA1]|nr:hypothetical protein [Cyanobacteria bacterium TGS_CYA1]
MQLDKRVLIAYALAIGFALLPLGSIAQEDAPDPGAVPGAKSTILDKLKDKSRQPLKVEPEQSKSHVMSVRDMLFERQVEHEKNLIHKFLLGVAIMFSIIATILFVSLPPQDADKLKAKTN